MARLSEQDIEVAFGPGEAKAAPGSATEAAVNGIRELDKKMEALVEKHRRPDETHESAYVRAMNENPALMAAYERERGKVLKANGFDGGVE